MPPKIHYKTEIKLDIYSNLSQDAPKLMEDTLKNVWPETPLANLDVTDYIDLIVDLWLRHYINNINTINTIEKIKNNNPPKYLKIYLIFNIFDDNDNLIIDYSEVDTTPLFRIYLPTSDLWDTYIYNTEKNKFESLEIIEPAYVEEIKLGMTEKEKMILDDVILQAYSFHNRLLGISSKKILLYTAQSPDKINKWNKDGIIPKGIYFTDKLARANYYFEEGDIIVDYRLPEDKLVMTSEFGGAKEFVTIEDISIK